MKISRYLKDKLNSILVFILFYIIILVLLIIFKTKRELNIFILFLLLIMGIILLLLDFFRKRNFYNKLIENISDLDQKYLILEFMNEPDFYEGKILYELLYEINKSYIEKMNEYKKNVNSFKEYVEMWIHEVKLPISTMVLLNHNHKLDKRMNNQLNKIDNYIDQILYYVRSENAEKDYIIKETSIKKIINNVLLKNKDDIIENNIELEVEIKDEKILTDGKWMEFILNQIINNSIKYRQSNPIIKIKYKNNLLEIYDNGIGIKESDKKRVFDKMFTGENGKENIKSTGMGLYIVKEMCSKLGHEIMIESEENKYTCVKITFKQNDYYNVTKM